MKDRKIVKQIREAGRLNLDGVMEMLKTDKESVVALLESGRIKSKKVKAESVVYDTDVFDYMQDELVGVFERAFASVNKMFDIHD